MNNITDSVLNVNKEEYTMNFHSQKKKKEKGEK